MKEFAIVVAADQDGGIGRDGGLPWRLPADLAHFREITTQGCAANTVIMGRKTWESLPASRRPLPGRHNVVLSRAAAFRPAGAAAAASLEEALAAAPAAGRVFVIGGGEVYRAALASPACGWIYLTRIHGRHGCDVFLPPFEPAFEEVRAGPVQEHQGLRFQFLEYRRRRGP